MHIHQHNIIFHCDINAMWICNARSEGEKWDRQKKKFTCRLTSVWLDEKIFLLSLTCFLSAEYQRNTLHSNCKSLNMNQPEIRGKFSFLFFKKESKIQFRKLYSSFIDYTRLISSSLQCFPVLVWIYLVKKWKI